MALTDSLIGKEILNYRILEVIGGGGMGKVYLAQNKFIAEQKVAIKVINHDMLNDFTRAKLEEEAHRLASLNHPNIVRLINFHKDTQGSCYLIMEYASGVSIETYINEINGLVVEDRICPLFDPILDGISAAHNHRNAQGQRDPIIHCDIKPANIIVTPSAEPTVKILDFGIAKIVSQQDDSTQLVMGTPSYMSPEQVKGEKVDARSDIYSLGVLLHQMLTGNAPYDTTTLTEQDIHMKVIEEPLPRIATYYKYVSEKVQKVVDKATAKDPNDRYQSCEEFKRALHRAIYPPTMSRWTKLALAAAAVIVIILGFSLWDYNRTKITYYKDYVEVYGVPKGVGKVSKGTHKHLYRSYKFVSKRGKLLRVSHVNSCDNLIDDDESERNERPIDQELAYSANGTVSSIRVKDRCGKVLYVKSYNDKLNVMVFQYDDEHNTERVVSNSTVGYGRLLENNDDDKGRISRWWIEYDDKGYVVSEKYHSIDNSPVCDANGIYGRTYVRDDKGRPIEIHYIGIDGEPQATTWGLGIKTFEYDSHDNWTRAIYLTTDGQAAYDDEDGVAIFAMEYDKYGNVTDAHHLNADGEPMIPRKNYVAGVHNTYNSHGQLIEECFLDTEGKPLFVRGTGIAMKQYEYDDNGYVCRQTFCDTNGDIIECKSGYAIITSVNDSHGMPIEQWYRDKSDALCDTSGGYAGMKSEYDDIGNCTKEVFFDTDENPTINNNGVAGMTATYNDLNLIEEITYLDKDLTPALNKYNVAYERYEYDKRGNTTKVAYYDLDGTTPVLSSANVAGYTAVYDDNGNITEVAYFDTKGLPAISSDYDYAKVTYRYNDNGYLIAKRYYDPSGNLTLVNGTAGYDYQRDRQGNAIESKPIGTNNQLATNYLIGRSKYDANNNCTETAYFNATAATTNQYGVHKYEYVYNSRNQIIEERHYGTSGALTICHDDNNCAIETTEYDDNGYCVSTAYFGTNHEPVNCDDGYSRTTYEHDIYGNVTKICFFGTDGKPTDPSVMVPVAIAQYDNWGNRIYLAGQDAKGNLVKQSDDTWAIERTEYDRRSNVTAESYFDTADKPTTCDDGYHIKRYVYDEQDRLTEVTYFGTDGKPTRSYNVYREVYSYEGKTNNIKELAFYGPDGSAVNCAAGWHKVTVSFNAAGTPTTRKYVTTSGATYGNQRWTGTTWETITTWQDNAAALAAELPQDYDVLVIQSLRITGNNSCEITMRTPYAYSELDSNDIAMLREVVETFVNNVEAYLNHKPYVTGILYDRTGEVICRYTK